MSDEQEARVGDRLARLKKPTRPRRKLTPYLVPTATLVLGMGIGAYLMLPEEDDAVTIPGLPTSTVSEFQQESGLAGFTITRPTATATQPTPQPRIQAKAPDEAQPDPAVAELTRRLSAMERENAAALERLQSQVEAEKARTDEKEAARAAAEAERRRLEEELLNSAGLGPTDPAAAEAEARRLADLEARRQEAADLRQRRITSPIVAFSASGSRAAGGPSQAEDNEPAGAASGEAPADFLRAGAARAAITRAERLADPGHTIVQGTMIEAVLETSIESSLPGNVAATVSQDVWAMDMSQILIPRGSKLYGRYSAEIEQGQRRVMIAWDRIIRADGMTVALEGYGTDRVGRSGLTGKVNNHSLSRFGAAAMVSVIGALPAILEAAASDGDEDEDDNNQLGQIYAGIGQGASGAVSGVMAGYLNRSPTITIPHGQVVIVRVNSDMEIF